MCSLEGLGRLKCRATGLDASLSSFSTSRRCSRNRSPNRLPVSVATPISSHVKDKNGIFTAHDEDMIF